MQPTDVNSLAEEPSRGALTERVSELERTVTALQVTQIHFRRRANRRVLNNFACRLSACICFGRIEMFRSSAAHASTPPQRKLCATRRKCAPPHNTSQIPILAPASLLRSAQFPYIIRRSGNQKAARDAAATAEQLEQQLSALKSTCASLEAEVATQRLLADSAAEAADAAAARAHSSLTQNIALKKKMREEVPRLAGALAKAQADRDAAVKQREIDAAHHTVEQNMTGSKLAGTHCAAAASYSPLLHPAHLCCSLHLSNKRCRRASRAVASAVRVSESNSSCPRTWRDIHLQTSVVGARAAEAAPRHRNRCCFRFPVFWRVMSCASVVCQCHPPPAVRDSEKVAWVAQVQQLQLALAASKDEVAAVTSSCEQRLTLMTDQCKAAAAAAAASESSAKASAAQLHGVKQEVSASEARVHALAAKCIAAEAELAVEKEVCAAAVARSHKAEAEAAAAGSRANDAAAAAAAEVEAKQLEASSPLDCLLNF
jgi:hypothetical protein